MADPQVIVCESQCTVTVVHEISLPVLELSPAEGAVIASAVLAVWAVGWAVRQLVLLIRGFGSTFNQPE